MPAGDGRGAEGTRRPQATPVARPAGCKQVTDAGLKELAALKQLQSLYLGGCDKLTKQGKDDLKKALPKLKVFE